MTGDAQQPDGSGTRRADRTTVVIDPGLGFPEPADLLDRRPDLDVTKPDDVVAALANFPPPNVLVMAQVTWEDRYLEALAAGDWVATVGVGYDALPVGTFGERGIRFTNSPGVSAPQVAEHVFAMATSFTRQLGAFRERQERAAWGHPEGTFSDLAGDACCIVGLGGIGEAVAERAAAFGMTVRGVKRDVEDHAGVADAVLPPDRLAEALAGARLLVISAPLTEATRGLIGAAQLEALSDDAIVTNVARGPILDTDALVAALRDDRIAAAGLDVTDPSPLPEDSPLWDRDDVLVTSHSAGQSEKYTRRFVDRFLAQLDRWERGAPLSDRVV